MASRRAVALSAAAGVLLVAAVAVAQDLWAPVYEPPRTMNDPGRAELVRWAPKRTEVDVPPPPGAVLVGADFLGNEGVKGAPMMLFLASPRPFAEVAAFYDARLKGLVPVDMDDGSRMYWVPQPGVDPLDADPPVVTVFRWAGEVARRKVPGARTEISVYVVRQ